MTPAKPDFSKQPLLEKRSKARVLLDAIKHDSSRSPGAKLMFELDLAIEGLKVAYEKTQAVTGNWMHAVVGKRSLFTKFGLLGGMRYWFRVAGLANDVQGPWSDPVTKIAP